MKPPRETSSMLDRACHGEDAKILAYGRLADDVRKLLQAGQRPDANSLAQRHPELADEIHELVPALAVLEEMGGEPPDLANDATVGGTMLGDYRIVREVGRGGMGVVYEARQISLERRVAIKVLPFAAVLDKKQLQRFKNEAQVAAQLVHQNIVPVYSVGSDRGVHFYAMQYVDGRTLARVIDELRADGLQDNVIRSSDARETARNDTSVTVDQYGTYAESLSTTTARSSSLGKSRRGYFYAVARVGSQVADALEYAHGEGVVHRDIKPSNLILDDRGKVWITDFGLAHIDAGQSLTVTGDILGTLRYMSPEQALAQRVVVDQRTDVYSLGVTLYELATLRPAFSGNNRQELVRQIIFDEPRRPRRQCPNVPVDLETIILKAMEKDPTDRYATAGAMAEDLRRFVDGRSIQARRPTYVRRAAKWCRRHAFPVATVAVALLGVLCCIAAGALVMAGRERAARREVEDANQKYAVLLASSYLDQGHMLCSQGDLVAGMLWMAHGLHIAPDQSPHLSYVIRQNLAAWSNRLHLLQTVMYHDQPVTTVTFCQSGSRVFTGHRDGSGQFWDAASGKRLGPTFTFEDVVLASSYNPQKNLVAAGTGKGKVTLMDSSTCLPVGESFQVDGSVQALAFNRAGNRILIGTNKSASLHELESRRLVTTKAAPELGTAAVSFSLDDTPLALLETGRTWQLWDLESERSIGLAVQKFDPDRKSSATAPNEARFAAAIAPDGLHFAAGGGKNRVWYWNALTGKRMLEMEHGGDIWAVVFSPDGNQLASGGFDSVVLIRDVRTGERQGHPLDHTSYILSPAVAFGSESRSLLAGATDGTTRLWELAVENPRPLRIAGGQRDTRTALRAGRQPFIVLGTNDAAFLAVENKPFGSVRPVADVAFGRHGLRVAIVARDREVDVWDTGTGVRVGHLATEAPIRDAKLSPDGFRIVTTHRGHARLWDVKSGRQIGASLRHAETVSCVNFSLDGTMLVTGGYDCVAQVWDAETLVPIGKPFVHDNHVEGVAFSPDGKRIATATSGRTGYLWDLETHQVVGRPLQHQAGLRAIAFCPDTSRPLVLTGSLDHTAQLWDIQTGKPIGPSLDHGEEVWGVSFSRDGSQMVVAGRSMVRRWDIPPPAVGGVLERVDLWVELITGQQLDMDRRGAIHPIKASAWRSRHRRLRQLGGSPLP